MNDVRKCRTMPDGTRSVMTFLLVEHDEDLDCEKTTFISMNGWDNFDCEELDESPEEIQEIWDLTESAAIKIIWANIKEHTLQWL